MEKVKIKRNIVINVWNVLSSLQDEKMNIKTTYAIVRNRKTLQPEIESIQETVKASDGYIKYEQERVNLCKEFADKDDAGNPIISNNGFVFSNEGLTKFQAKFDVLRDDNKDEIEAFKSRQDEFEKELDDELELEFYQLSVDDLPNNILTVSQFEILMEAGIISD